MLKSIRQIQKNLRQVQLDHRRRGRIIRATNKLFDQAQVKRLPVKIRNSQEPLAPSDVILRKRQGHIDALVNQSFGWPANATVQNKIGCYAYWLNATSDQVKQIVVSACDGNLPTLADYKFSATSSKYTLLPDSYFFRDHGFITTDQFAETQALAWEARSDKIIWRGRPNGTGLFNIEEGTVEKPGVVHRLQMARACQKLGIDFRFIPDPTQRQHFVLQEAGLIGEFVPALDWGGMKYAIDIDGFTNTWCNFIRRLKLGCCVLKVDSAFGFRQWYYDQITPWEHFVPIRADLTDLAEKVDWVRSHPDEAKQIAANGQAFAKTLTFESETSFAVTAIEEREAQN